MPASTLRRRLLIIEDNPVNLELFLDILSETPHECFSAMDGPSGLAIAREVKPDLIFLDIQLPGMDGIEVMKCLKASAETSSANIVALTAYAMKGDRESFLREGFDDYIAKPVRIQNILDTIARFLGPGKASP